MIHSWPLLFSLYVNNGEVYADDVILQCCPTLNSAVANLQSTFNHLWSSLVAHKLVKTCVSSNSLTKFNLSKPKCRLFIRFLASCDVITPWTNSNGQLLWISLFLFVYKALFWQLSAYLRKPLNHRFTGFHTCSQSHISLNIPDMNTSFGKTTFNIYAL